MRKRLFNFFLIFAFKFHFLYNISCFHLILKNSKHWCVACRKGVIFFAFFRRARASARRARSARHARREGREKYNACARSVFHVRMNLSWWTVHVHKIILMFNSQFSQTPQYNFTKIILKIIGVSWVFQTNIIVPLAILPRLLMAVYLVFI